jgi:hypothetical protein
MRRILYTYICIDTRIDYAKDNYSIMSLLFVVVVVFFETIGIISHHLFSIQALLHLSPNAHLRVYDGQFFLSFYAASCFKFITFKRTNTSDGYE